MNPKLQAIRQRIEHEDNLINQRLSALLSSQSFLLTAFAISLNGPKEFAQPGYQNLSHLMTRYVPWVGIGCIIALAVSIAGAILSLGRLQRLAAGETGPDDMPISSPAIIRLCGHTASILVPALFLILWIILLSSVV